MDRVELQEKIDNLKNKQDLFGKRIMDVEIGDDGRAYITNIYDMEERIEKIDWVDGYLVEDKIFATINDICEHYGIIASDLICNQYDSLTDAIKNCTEYYFKGINKCWTLKELCDELSFDYEEVFEYLKKNPDKGRAGTLDDFLYKNYKMGIYINIFGERVIPAPE